MRLLRSMELVLALGLAALLVVAGWWRPSGFVAAGASGPAAGQAGERPRVSSGFPVPATGAPTARELLDAAAHRHGLPTHLVEAVAYWESGWTRRASPTPAPWA